MAGEIYDVFILKEIPYITKKGVEKLGFSIDSETTPLYEFLQEHSIEFKSIQDKLNIQYLDMVKDYIMVEKASRSFGDLYDDKSSDESKNEKHDDKESKEPIDKSMPKPNKRTITRFAKVKAIKYIERHTEFREEYNKELIKHAEKIGFKVLDNESIKDLVDQMSLESNAYEYERKLTTLNQLLYNRLNEYVKDNESIDEKTRQQLNTLQDSYVGSLVSSFNAFKFKDGDKLDVKVDFFGRLIKFSNCEELNGKFDYTPEMLDIIGELSDLMDEDGNCIDQKAFEEKLVKLNRLILDELKELTVDDNDLSIDLNNLYFKYMSNLKDKKASLSKAKQKEDVVEKTLDEKKSNFVLSNDTELITKESEEKNKLETPSSSKDLSHTSSSDNIKVHAPGAKSYNSSKPGAVKPDSKNGMLENKEEDINKEEMVDANKIIGLYELVCKDDENKALNATDEYYMDLFKGILKPEWYYENTFNNRSKIFNIAIEYELQKSKIEKAIEDYKGCKDEQERAEKAKIVDSEMKKFTLYSSKRIDDRYSYRDAANRFKGEIQALQLYNDNFGYKDGFLDTPLEYSADKKEIEQKNLKITTKSHELMVERDELNELKKANKKHGIWGDKELNKKIIELQLKHDAKSIKFFFETLIDSYNRLDEKDVSPLHKKVFGRSITLKGLSGIAHYYRFDAIKAKTFYSRICNTSGLENLRNKLRERSNRKSKNKDKETDNSR